MNNDQYRQATYLPANQPRGVRNQVSVQPYSELKYDLDDEGRFRLQMCTISAAFFVVNLIATAILATCLLWQTATPGVSRQNDEFVQCQRTEALSTSAVTSRPDGKKAGPEQVTCSSLSRAGIKQSILEDCDENSDDELRLHLPKEDCHKAAEETLLNKWLVKLNQSSVTVGKDGSISVRYSGIYIVHSSLAFTCNSLSSPSTANTTYWQEIRVNNVTYFRDAENITRVPVIVKPSYCYRSFLYGLLRLTANDSIQIFAGPPELLHCDDTMSFLVLNRP